MISVEKKLELIAKIRQENSKNIQTMRGREDLLYGNNMHTYNDYRVTVSSLEGDNIPKISSLQLRTIIMILIVLSIIILDQNQVTIVQKYLQIFMIQISNTSHIFEWLQLDLLFSNLG